MEQKTIFIKGASRGIGKSIALLFASRGYHTFLNCSSSVDELKKLRAYITEKYHTPCTLVPGNVGNPDHVRAIYNKIYQECTHLDVLINNAGISYINLLTDMTDEDWNRIIQTNLSSVFYCCRQAIPPMVSKRSGKIINISSMWGHPVLPVKLHTLLPSPASTDLPKRSPKNSHRVTFRLMRLPAE